MADKVKATSGVVPVPNRFFDVLLPELSDPALRVYLVVLRATLGWREGAPGGGTCFKARDWLTNRQLVKRTGKSSAAVSRAIDELVRTGLIRVEDAEGTALHTPAERRRNLGRLYFRPVDKWITVSNSDMGKLQRTTYRRNNNRRTIVRRMSPGSVPQRQSTGLVQVKSLIASHRVRLSEPV